MLPHARRLRYARLQGPSSADHAHQTMFKAASANHPCTDPRNTDKSILVQPLPKPSSLTIEKLHTVAVAAAKTAHSIELVGSTTLLQIRLT